jgi:hypothetical protein
MIKHSVFLLLLFYRKARKEEAFAEDAEKRQRRGRDERTKTFLMISLLGSG